MTGQITSTVSIGGISIASSVPRTDENAVIVDLSGAAALVAGKAAVLTTKTNTTEGVITAPLHGYTDANTLDVFWIAATGIVAGARYGCVIASYDANTLTISGGTGDDLPLQAAALVICAEAQYSCPIDGDQMSMFAVKCTARANVTFLTAVPGTLKNIKLAANEAYVWVGGTNDSGFTVESPTNPLTGAPVATFKVGHAGISASDLIVVALLDATP